MPTWRVKNAGKHNPKLGIREYSESFKETDYFKFFNNLINDTRLIDVMKKKGYKGKFVLHPAHICQAIDFKGNDTIYVETNVADYQKEFKENKLMITDYSSVSYDFAYLKKPLIYAQFDADTFFEGQAYDKGYFDDERDGFGPVCYNYEDTVNQIIKYIENDCKMEEKYEKRVNDFYYRFDTDNCKRVYNEILKL